MCVYVFVVLFQVLCKEWCVYISWRPERGEVPSFITKHGVCTCMCERDKESMLAEEVWVDFLRSIDTQRCFDILDGEAEGDRSQHVCMRVCMCGSASVNIVLFPAVLSS